MQKQLKAYLKSAGINQSEFARRVGVHRSVVSHWLTGYCKPERDRIQQIAKVTGIRVEDML
jgi:transcriptional regulator with XRE-family HTH domain